MDLTADEQALVDEIGFDQATCQKIKTLSGKRLELLQAIDENGESVPAAGVSIAIEDGEEAERLMILLRPHLAPRGYRSFWSARHEPNGLKTTDELAILHTQDAHEIIRLRRTDGANCDVFMEDILDRLDAWRKISDFEIVGADRDWVALQFSRLPQKLCAFAEEVYLFCPDTVVQGVGLAREKDEPERFRAARDLCPGVSGRIRRTAAEKLATIESLAPELLELPGNSSLSDEIEMGVRLLALDLKMRKYLFMWWD